MSGRKRVMTRISADELRSLRNQALEATNLRQRNSLLNDLASKNDQAMRDIMNKQETQNRALTSLRNELGTEKETSRKLRDLLDRTIKENKENLESMSRANSEQIEALRNETDEKISRAGERITTDLTRKIEEAKKETDKEILSIRDEIERMNAGKKELLEAARENLALTDQLIQGIQSFIIGSNLIRGRLDALIREQEETRRAVNLAGTNPEHASVAMQRSREIFVEASELFSTCIAEENKWQGLYNTARQQIDIAVAEIEASREISIDGTSEKIDVDNWTSGDLSRIEGKLDTYQRALADTGRLTFDMLGNIISATGIAREEIKETAVAALVAAEASDQRWQTASDLADRLEQSNFFVQDDGYQNDDPRNGLRVIFRNNVTGQEMIVTQTPDKDKDTGDVCNTMEIDITDHGNANILDSHTEILGILSGVVGRENIETVQGYEFRDSDRTELRDMDRWRNEKPSETVRRSKS